jgi:hypothetical protein
MISGLMLGLPGVWAWDVLLLETLVPPSGAIVVSGGGASWQHEMNTMKGFKHFSSCLIVGPLLQR